LFHPLIESRVSIVYGSGGERESNPDERKIFYVYDEITDPGLRDLFNYLIRDSGGCPRNYPMTDAHLRAWNSILDRAFSMDIRLMELAVPGYGRRFNNWLSDNFVTFGNGLMRYGYDENGSGYIRGSGPYTHPRTDEPDDIPARNKRWSPNSTWLPPVPDLMPVETKIDPISIYSAAAGRGGDVKTNMDVEMPGFVRARARAVENPFARDATVTIAAKPKPIIMPMDITPPISPGPLNGFADVELHDTHEHILDRLGNAGLNVLQRFNYRPMRNISERLDEFATRAHQKPGFWGKIYFVIVILYYMYSLS